jgi:hypothetical protein
MDTVQEFTHHYGRRLHSTVAQEMLTGWLVERIVNDHYLVSAQNTCLIGNFRDADPYYVLVRDPDSNVCKVMAQQIFDAIQDPKELPWAKDLELVERDRLMGADGSVVAVVGPFYDARRDDLPKKISMVTADNYLHESHQWIQGELKRHANNRRNSMAVLGRIIGAS